MKTILIPLFCLTIICSAKAQIPVAGWGTSVDLLSNFPIPAWNLNQRIVNTNRSIATTVGLNTASTTEFTNTIDQQFKELSTISISLQNRSIWLQNFVKGEAFRPGSYSSYGYIQEKYPVNLINANDVFRNGIIRLRYRRKLIAEANKISDYLNVRNPVTRNPIPEGERVLLILNALENVINLTLENETF